jgi:hypothetical protein
MSAIGAQESRQDRQVVGGLELNMRPGQRSVAPAPQLTFTSFSPSFFHRFGQPSSSFGGQLTARLFLRFRIRRG